jgi:hypothetical protein
VVIAAYYYPALSSKLLGKINNDQTDDKNLEILIENKKKLLQLNASPTTAANLESLLLQEAQWGIGNEINKIYETLNKYHYHTELTDIALSIKHFYNNSELKKNYRSHAATLATITTHLCLFHLAYKKIKIAPMLCQSLNIDPAMALKLKKTTCDFLKISDEQSDDRVAISMQIYSKLEKFPDWTNVSLALQEILKGVEKNI